jgi:hypothetical protein
MDDCQYVSAGVFLSETCEYMSFYTHHSNTQAVQYFLVGVPPCHPGDIIPYDPQHQHTEGHRHRCVDVHSENSVKKIIFFITNIKIHENLFFGNFVTPHAKNTEFLSPFQLLQRTHKTYLKG